MGSVYESMMAPGGIPTTGESNERAGSLWDDVTNVATRLFQGATTGVRDAAIRMFRESELGRDTELAVQRQYITDLQTSRTTWLLIGGVVLVLVVLAMRR